jgi:adenosylhomocysteine nucleosidase
MGESFTANLGPASATFFHGGWGKISAAASTQYVIDHHWPDLLVNLGTCGGLRGRIEAGTIVLAERTVVYDIVELMGDARKALEHYSTNLDLDWLPSPDPSPVTRGLMVSADRDLLPSDLPALVGQYDAVAGDWESGAIAWVARRNGVRCLLLRGVSDLVGEEGGEAYGNLALFVERTNEIMQRLISILPRWLAAIEQSSPREVSVPGTNAGGK